jgi:2-hydroxychromene-2-carboxylate isomerase
MPDREGLEVTPHGPGHEKGDAASAASPSTPLSSPRTPAGAAEDVAGTYFMFDLGSPYAYLSAERISRLFAEEGLEQPEWTPILLGGLFQRFGRDSWMNGPDRAAGMREVERRAEAYGLQPIRWPDPCPANTLHAMRVATYAKSIGRSVSFALAAFRQAFAGGRDLTDPDNVAIAAAACELHPNAIARGAATESVKRTLKERTEIAGDLGVRGVPSVVVGGEVYWGDDRLEEAVAAAKSPR